MKGWVYVITNRSMPGLVKIGYSTKDPDLRADELNHSGTPHPYIVEYDALVEEPRDIEQKVHSRLAKIREGKEWFRCSPEEAVVAIQTVVGKSVLMQNFKHADRERAEAILQQREEEERARRFAEEEQKKHEIIIKQKREDIYDRYEKALKSVLPITSFLAYFILYSILAGLMQHLAIIVFPSFEKASKEDNISGIGLLVIFTIPLLIIAFLKYYSKRRAKKSDKYIALLQKRDEELVALDREKLSIRENMVL